MKKPKKKKPVEMGPGAPYLKPCAHCGNPEITIDPFFDSGHPACRIGCHKCGMGLTRSDFWNEGPTGETRQNAIDAWNRRTPEN